MSETLLRVSGLKTYFYTASGVAKAVDGVSFSLNRGEVLGIVGESGSGKSVTSNSIIRLLPPQTGRIVAGEILFEDRDILKMSNKELLEFRGKEIATIFQDPMTSLDPVFKIGKQMVEMICAHQKVSKAEARKLAVDALNRVGIPEPEKRMESYMRKTARPRPSIVRTAATSLRCAAPAAHQPPPPWWWISRMPC